MTEVLNAAVDGLEHHPDEKADAGTNTNKKPATDAGPDSASSPPSPPPPPPRRGIRDRDSRARRDDRDYHKQGRPSISPPPPYRDRRGGPHSPPHRRSPPLPPYKRRRDDGHDGRRGSPRGGYGRGDRR